AAGQNVVLLPHVIRDGDNDLDASWRVYRSLSERHTVVMIDRLLSPACVARITADSELVITGRMHLAVLGLAQGVPAIVLSTQGKVAGMLARFGLRDMSIEPGNDTADSVIARFESVMTNSYGLRQHI